MKTLPNSLISTEALTRLREFISRFESVVVAYSGGVDSALVMAVAGEVLGDHSLACIGVSPSYPQRELKAAVDLARNLNVRYELIHTDEHVDPRYAANPVNRCYFCKNELYQRLARIRDEQRLSVILDGTNATDLRDDDRPGYRAAREHGVRSPLAELGLSKDDVRKLAREMGLPVWDKPSMPCLSSRVPHGVAIVPQVLKQIEKAEDVLAGLGFTQFRVRHHGDVARVELPETELMNAIAYRREVVEGIRAAGYRFVSLDLAGFSSGSLHAAGKTSLTVIA